LVHRVPGARLAKNFLVHLVTARPMPPPSVNGAARIPINTIIVGTTGVCNASCIHCPTNKPLIEHLPTGVMPLPLYKSIIDQLADHCTISGCICYGLFGDALLDPYVVERVRYTRERLPHVPVQFSTNGAAYLRAKHKVLAEYVTHFGLHIESLRPEVYNELMQPLRLERVLPKVEMIIEDFGEKTFVAIPVSRANLGEIPAMRAWFKERGAGLVLAAPLSNRCNPTPAFDRLALDPQQTQCGGHVADSFIIDWAGDAYICCNDFQKEDCIGDFSTQTLLEVYNSPERKRVRDMLDAGRWSEMKTCSKCKFDNMLPDEEIDRLAAGGAMQLDAG
jgi:radical SAM protein with 4Fe4S-binding SPASM domain